MEELFTRLQTVYHSAVCILLIGPQEVRAIVTITWEVFTKNRGILPRIKEKENRTHVCCSQWELRGRESIPGNQRENI